LWRQPWKIGNIRAPLLIAPLIGAMSAPGSSCAERLAADTVERGERGGSG